MTSEFSHYILFLKMKQFLLIFMCIISTHTYHVLSIYTNKLTVYALEGDTVILKCKVHSNTKSTWNRIESKDSREYQTLIPYADGKEINPSLPNKQNIEIVGNIVEGDYNLEIQQVSPNDEGDYICSQTRNESDAQEFCITLKMAALPNDIKILNSKKGILEGEENKLLNLTCTVNSGTPFETITWYNMSFPIKSGGPGTLSIMAIPTRENHNKQYTCKVDSYSLINPLEETITLDIKYKPSLSIDNPNPIKVTEKRNLTISCTSNGNPVVNNMWIENVSEQVIKYCNAPTCRVKIIEINRDDAGLYKCKASNTIGTEEKTALVIVLYPPSVIITQHRNGTVLQCHPNGNPNKYTFYPWEHRSDLGETIRMLDNAPNLELLVDKGNYQLNGVYICRVENGVKDISGRIIRAAETSVRFADKPVFVSQNDITQYGRVGHPINIKVYVYSFPEITSIQVMIHGFDSFDIKNITTKDIIFEKEVYLPGYVITIEGYDLTRTDFTFYKLNVTNKIGHTEFKVVLKEAGAETINNIAGLSWVIFGSSIGGLVICCIGSHIVCVLIRMRKSNVVLEISPGQFYDEIGTLNSNNTIFQPIANHEEENHDDISVITDNNDIQIGIETEISDQSSVYSHSVFRQTSDEDYENPYQPINLEGIEMHSYNVLVTEHYQNTTIFPNSLASKTTNDILSADCVRKPWVIIYKRSKELT